MAEVQTSTQSGELSQRFVEFVMMQAQNAALFLGQIPNPQTGEAEVNLELAKMFVDQLAMIQEKTRGNLTNEESAVLRNALSNLQMAFVEVAQAQRVGGGSMPSVPPAAAGPAPDTAGEIKTSPAASSAGPGSSSPTAEPPPAEGESRKKFTKSYGA